MARDRLIEAMTDDEAVVWLRADADAARAKLRVLNSDVGDCQRRLEAATAHGNPGELVTARLTLAYVIKKRDAMHQEADKLSTWLKLASRACRN